MSLALIIPVRDDQRNLDRLLAQVRDMAIFDQIVIVDDASEPPVIVADTIIGPQRCPLILLRRDIAGGAGAARNLGLSMVQSDHMIFFDSDDLFTPEFAALWHSLSQRDFDFCLMRYQDSERGHFGGWGQNPHDEACWSRAALNNETLNQINPGQNILSEVSGPALWALAEAGNFPWNKIYRTAFLRDNALRCTETLVHNDIELHWTSFLAAERVLVSSRIGALHVVRPGADRLTNLSGQVRLQVFQALNCVLEPMQRSNDTLASHTFLRFAAGLLLWVERVITPDLQSEFHRRKRAFLRAALSHDIHETLIHNDPVLALSLSLQMADASC